MFTEYDIIVTIIVLISMITAFLHGAIKDVLSFLTWIGATIVTFLFFPQLQEIMSEFFKNSVVINIASIITMFIGSFIIITLIAALLGDNLRNLKGGTLDRVLGMAFGALKGLFIASLMHVAIFHLNGKEPDWLKESRSYEVTKAGADIMKNWFKKASSKGKDLIEESKNEIEANKDKELTPLERAHERAKILTSDEYEDQR